MLNKIKDKIRDTPNLYDYLTALKRKLGIKTPSYDAIKKISDIFSGRVNFIQIGSNDGLRNDPIREFIVNNYWSGLLIEPIPMVFEELKKNYSMVRGGRLTFVNAAISDRNEKSLSFWTFNEMHLNGLTKEEKLNHIRQSSFDRKHLESFHGKCDEIEKIVQEIRVPAYTLREIINLEWSDRGDINFLIIDAEGHEPTIIRSINYCEIRPNAIFFESHHLQEQQQEIFDILKNNGYILFAFAGDTIAYDTLCKEMVSLYAD